MSIKLRLNEKRRVLYEDAIQDAKNQTLQEIEKIWGEIETGGGYLHRLQNSIASGSGGITGMVDVTKLTRVRNSRTGQIINPSEIAEEAARILSDYVPRFNIKGLSDVLSYWKYPIVWSFDVQTACTDGVRIAFNPFFYDELQQRALNQYIETHTPEESKDTSSQAKMERNFTKIAPFLFVIVHEAYHQIYLHIARENIASFVPKTAQGHKNANYAQDAEINRDITEYHFRDLKKGFQAISGVDESDQFKFEDWEDIYKAFASGEKTPKWPGYFSEEPIEENNWEEQEKNKQKRPDTTPEYDKGYKETYNKLAKVWNSTHDVGDVLKSAEDMGLDIVI